MYNLYWDENGVIVLKHLGSCSDTGLNPINNFDYKRQQGSRMLKPELALDPARYSPWFTQFDI